MSAKDRPPPTPASARENVKLAAVREALRRDTGAADSVDVLTALVDAIDNYRSETAMLDVTR